MKRMIAKHIQFTKSRTSDTPPESPTTPSPPPPLTKNCHQVWPSLWKNLCTPLYMHLKQLGPVATRVLTNTTHTENKQNKH